MQEVWKISEYRKIVDNLRILAEYMLQMEIRGRIEEEDKTVKSLNDQAYEKYNF